MKYKFKGKKYLYDWADSSTATRIVERIVKEVPHDQVSLCSHEGWVVLCSHMEDSCPGNLPVPSVDLKREQINKPLYIKPLGFQFFLFPYYNVTYLDWYINHSYKTVNTLPLAFQYYFRLYICVYMYTCVYTYIYIMFCMLFCKLFSTYIINKHLYNV